MRDLALVAQLDERSERFLQRHVRIDPMQLVELDALEPQPREAALTGAAQMLRSTVRMPPVRAAARQTAFRGDHQLVGVGI